VVKKLKHRKRIKFRIWVWCSIALFLLIPLLSPQVAAEFNQPLGKVWTNNTPGGPTAGLNVGAPTNISDDGIPLYRAKFSVEYSYTDSNPNGTGSIHWTEIIVYWLPPGTNTWLGPNICSQTPISISANWGTKFGTYTTPWVPLAGGGYGGVGTIFNVYVGVNCHDNATSYTYTLTSNVIVFDII
jgi:hypothetical protein